MTQPVLHMSRLEPDLTQATRFGLTRGLLPPGADDGYLWHALLKAVFGDLAPKPFRFVEPERRRPYLVGYGEADRSALLAQAAAFAEPDAAEAIGLSSLATKAMPGHFAEGTRLGFETRLRPVSRTTRNDPIGPGREIDIFLAAAIRAPSEKLDRGIVYSQWVARQLAKGGATVDLQSLRLVSARRARLLRRGAADEEGRRPVRAFGKKGGGPDIVIAGELTIVNPAAFAALLGRGVGRHRAFGFGMLLLKPPSRGG
jgi:CRISPR system Cascade subunit CasE